MRSTPAASRRSEAPAQFKTRRLRWRAILPALLIPLVGCTMEPSTALPEGATSFTPPAEYQAWWASTEACSAKVGNMRTVEWYVVPGVSTFGTSEGDKVGIRIKSGDRVSIVIAGNYVEHEMVVRHEMLHALLGVPGHPPEYFVDRCHLTWESWAATHTADDPPPTPNGDQLS